MDVILSSDITPDNIAIREQVIGEARAYRICAAYPEAHHKKITKLKESREKNQDEKPEEYPFV